MCPVTDEIPTELFELTVRDIAVAPNWFIKRFIMCRNAYGCVHLKYPLESLEKRRSRFLYVADMTIKLNYK